MAAPVRIRLPVVMSPEGAENFRRLASMSEPDPLVKTVIEELLAGFPVTDRDIRVTVAGDSFIALADEIEWDITHPDVEIFELDLDQQDVDLDPPGVRIFGTVQLVQQEDNAAGPRARFLCTGIRDLRRDYR